MSKYLVNMQMNEQRTNKWKKDKWINERIGWLLSEQMNDWTIGRMTERMSERSKRV